MHIWESINSTLGWMASQLWGFLLIYLLIGAGIYFTLFSGALQIRYFGHMWSLLLRSRKGAADGVTSFQAFATSLGTRVGTGNLAGVAVAMTKGGPGALFWMWMTAMLGMATCYFECSLAQLYKERHEDGSFRGGPAYYIEKGLGWRWMSRLFSICLVIGFGFAATAFQANSISEAVVEASGHTLENWWIGVALVAITAPVVFGGLRSVVRVAEIIVPIMAVGYLLLTVVVLGLHVHEIPQAFMEIVKSAFGLKQAAWGAAGYGIAVAMQNGVRRGLFSNEAGMGSAPNAAAVARTEPNHPAAQGFVQSVGVFIDTLVICTCTGLIIMVSGLLHPGMEADGISFTQQALSTSIGSTGIYFIAVAICFFSFSSIIGDYSYSEANVEYMGSRGWLLPLRLVFLVITFIGSISSLDFVVNFADVSMGTMAVINLIAVLLLSPIGFKILKDYGRQLKVTNEPKFLKKDFPEFADQLAPTVWEGLNDNKEAGE